MNNSADKYDLAGAFEGNPIPTLILEGKWDLTWAESKKDALKRNHPNSRMVVFENAGHSIYDEETEKFFYTLKDFISNLPKTDENKLNKYSGYLKQREAKIEADPRTIIRRLNWGLASSKKLTESYNREWLKTINDFSQYQRTGFALYDMDNYKEALFVFEQLAKISAEEPKKVAFSLIWQGHMLDLMGNRDEAIKRYSRACDMNLDDLWSHGQYNLQYKLSPYAKERMVKPFVKIENSTFD
jgi:tetratricopeptide (TPR) repeat protein